MNSHTETVLLFRAFKHRLGWLMSRHYRYYKRRYLVENPEIRSCVDCGKKVRRYKGDVKKSDTLSIDHIIPQSYLWELELIDLIFDMDNFQIHCLPCNSRKSNRLPKASEIPQKLLNKFRVAIDQRNKEIFSV